MRLPDGSCPCASGRINAHANQSPAVARKARATIIVPPEQVERERAAEMMAMKRAGMSWEAVASAFGYGSGAGARHFALSRMER